MDAFDGILAVDIETASACDIKSGAWAYSQHESTQVYCVVFGFAAKRDDDYAILRWQPGDQLPPKLRRYLDAGGSLLAHNASFERAVFTNILCPKFDFPTISVEQWRDTQALGLSLNLPMSLDGLTKALGCPQKKDKEGGELMKLMTTTEWSEEDATWRYPYDTPDRRERLLLYCERDVRATLDAWFLMPKMSVVEHRLWVLDQKINTRGVYLDQEFAEQCRTMASLRKSTLAVEAHIASGLELPNSTNSHQLKPWLKSRGIELPKTTRKKSDGAFHQTETTDAHAVAALLAGELPDDVRAVLSNRVEANKATSLAKLNRVAAMVGTDGRLRNALQYCGAHTGRWTSSGFQVHNLPKDKLDDDSDLAREAVKTGDLSVLQLFFVRALAALSMLLRSVLAAPRGRELIAADFAAIEARVLTWLVDDRELLTVFARGEDVYVYTAESISATCTDHPWRKGCPKCELARQLGKVCRLALGYGMGALKLADTGGKAGITMPLKEWRTIHKTWRDTNPLVQQFWRELDETVKQSIAAPGEVFRLNKLRVYTKTACLFIQLPSGRCLRYWKPEVVLATKKIKVVDEDGAIVEREFESEEIQFYTMGPNKSAMVLESTYGGKLVENVVQAVARDLLGEALLRLDAAGYDLVVHVHDSAAAEVHTGKGSVDQFCEIMAELPPWAIGCPIDVEGYRAPCFRG